MTDGRQPFYRRNCDVDEISYQITHQRTLMSEIGIVEHQPGEFSRIPRGVAHDSRGRRESHLLFYAPAPVSEEQTPVRTSQEIIPPFPGWQPGQVNEAVTQRMGTSGHDMCVFSVDELKLLEQVHADKERLCLLRGSGEPGMTWRYGSAGFHLGIVRLAASKQRVYRRVLDADQIQYQVSGHRTLISQRGIVELGPGDFVRIPLGIAHMSLCGEQSEHIALYVNRELRQIAETARIAEPYTPGRHVAFFPGVYRSCPA